MAIGLIILVAKSNQNYKSFTIINNIMKQTAVEFQTEKIGILVSKLFNDEISKAEFHFKRFEISYQAKEMEKQQIENAFDNGWNRANETKHQAYTTLEDIGSNYYNEQFKNK